eukprot:m.14645 g.14645  ORF g.14645 m.14645 type:complete len:256 (-) comp23078_c0_seq1:129-896(-)
MMAQHLEATTQPVFLLPQPSLSVLQIEHQWFHLSEDRRTWIPFETRENCLVDGAFMQSLPIHDAQGCQLDFSNWIMTDTTTGQGTQICRVHLKSGSIHPTKCRVGPCESTPQLPAEYCWSLLLLGSRGSDLKPIQMVPQYVVVKRQPPQASPAAQAGLLIPATLIDSSSISAPAPLLITLPAPLTSVPAQPPSAPASSMAPSLAESFEAFICLKLQEAIDRITKLEVLTEDEEHRQDSRVQLTLLQLVFRQRRNA